MVQFGHASATAGTAISGAGSLRSKGMLLVPLDDISDRREALYIIPWNGSETCQPASIWAEVLIESIFGR